MRGGDNPLSMAVGGKGRGRGLLMEDYLSLLKLTLCSSGLSVIVWESLRAERH